METLNAIKKKVAGFSVKYIPVENPLDPCLKTMISRDDYVKYSAYCEGNTIKVLCKEEEIDLVKNLEGTIKNKLARELWISMLKKETSEEIQKVLSL